MHADGTHGREERPSEERLPEQRPPLWRLPGWATGWPVAIVLLLVHWALAFSAVSGKSNVFDEALHQTAGYTYWTLGDYRVHPENGNLPQRIFALPLLASGAWQLPDTDSAVWRQGEQWSVAWRFYFAEDNDFRGMLRRGRAVAALIGTGVVALVWLWSRSLFGAQAGLLSLLLASLSPTLLSHGPLLTSDALLALLLPASLLGLWRVFHRITPARLLGSSVVAGLLFVTKFSAPIVIPMAALLGFVRLIDGRPLGFSLGRRSGRLATRGAQTAALLGVAAVHAVVVFVTIWAFYGFRYSAFADDPNATAGAGRFMDSWETLLDTPGSVAPAVGLLREQRLLPEAYLYGVAFVDHHTRARFAFLDGEFGVTGWWWFFPYAFAIKTPLALFGLLALAAAAAIRAGPLARGLHATAPLWVLLVVYWAASLPLETNVGLRHILPTYPALFVAAGLAARWLEWRQRLLGPAVAMLVVAFAAASFSIRPHYLANFNTLVGGPAHGYRHLVDSSLDWGQDLPGLAAWLDTHGAGETAYLSYFGSSSPRAWGVDARALPGYHETPGAAEPFELAGGLYCISATLLQGVYTSPPGPWTASNEAAYQRLRAGVAPGLREGGRRTPAFREAYERYHRLRFGRLSARLRRREPDANAGYSILIYRLTDGEVRAALEGPPPEIAPELDALLGERDT